MGHLSAIAMSKGAAIRGLTREGPGGPNTSAWRARLYIRTARSTTGQGPEGAAGGRTWCRPAAPSRWPCNGSRSAPAVGFAMAPAVDDEERQMDIEEGHRDIEAW